MKIIIYKIKFCYVSITSVKYHHLLYEKQYDILRVKNILVKSVEDVTDNIYFLILCSPIIIDEQQNCRAGGNLSGPSGFARLIKLNKSMCL